MNLSYFENVIICGVTVMKLNDKGEKASLSTTGIILEEFSDFDGNLGLSYLNGGDLFSVTQVFKRPAVIFPRCHTIIKIELLAEKKVFQLDAYAVLVLAKNIKHSITGITPLSHVATVFQI